MKKRIISAVLAIIVLVTLVSAKYLVVRDTSETYVRVMVSSYCVVAKVGTESDLWIGAFDGCDF